MIVNFKHKGLKALFEKGDRSKLPQAYINKIRRVLQALHSIQTADELEALVQETSPGRINPNPIGVKIHPLKGDRSGQYAAESGRNFRITFYPITIDDKLELLHLDYEDYH